MVLAINYDYYMDCDDNHKNLEKLVFSGFTEHKRRKFIGYHNYFLTAYNTFDYSNNDWFSIVNLKIGFVFVGDYFKSPAGKYDFTFEDKVYHTI